MRKLFALSLAALVLAGCGSIPFLSGEIRVTADELSQRMARRFPVEKSVGGLLDVTLTRPNIELDAADSRLAASFDVAVKLPLTKKTHYGSLKISGRPEYDTASRSLFLRGARVDQIRMEHMPDALSGGLAKAASGIARDVMEDKALYVFKPEDFTKYGVRYEPDRVEVRADALVLKVK
ncbi:MAG: DUF1439 domain-containing protein [Usitatibacteraceae bacterium]